MSKPVPVENDTNQQVAILRLPGLNADTVEYQLPVVKDIHGKPYIITSNLLSETGYITLDTGLRSTAIAESHITRILASSSDHKEGLLQYRGYDVKQLATSCSFLEVSYLLINGELPNETEFKAFSEEVRLHRILDKQTEDMIEGFDKQTNPMITLMGTMSSLASRYESSYDMHKAEDRQELAVRLIGKMPTIAAYIYKHILGQRPIAPDDSLGHTANFLHMLLSTQTTAANVDQSHIKILDMILTLHADHQMAVSTLVARSVSSAGTPTISSINAAIAALSGPLHGGANQQVIDMLTGMEEEDIPSVLDRAKDKADSFKLFGFGHRVYNGTDPRAAVLRELTVNLLKKGSEDPELEKLFQVALKLEEAALEDEYFTSRNLFPNVDFYSGLAFKAIGIPTELFTVLFAMSRTSGWLAHIEEAWSSNDGLYRPRQYYTGRKQRPTDWP